MYNNIPLKIKFISFSLTHTGSLQLQISLLCELNNNDFLGQKCDHKTIQLTSV